MNPTKHDMTIQVQAKKVYGNELIYPHDNTAKLLARLVGAKTFNAHHMILIQELGYTIELVAFNGTVIETYSRSVAV